MKSYRIIKEGIVFDLRAVELEGGIPIKVQKGGARLSGESKEDVLMQMRSAIAGCLNGDVLDETLKPVKLSVEGEIKKTKEVQEFCSVDRCSNKVQCKGWCRSHYTNFARTGDPLNALR